MHVDTNNNDTESHTHYQISRYWGLGRWQNKSTWPGEPYPSIMLRTRFLSFSEQWSLVFPSLSLYFVRLVHIW